MRILVCVKFVPAVTEGMGMDENHSMIRDGVVHQLNVADEAAVELALRLKGTGSVTVMTMGKTSYEEGLKELLAKGVEEAVLLTDRRFSGADTFATAKTLAEAVKELGDFDLILCGRRAIDGETGQVPSQLAAFLELPCVTNVILVEEQSVEEGEPENGNRRLRCVRLVEDGQMELEVAGTAVVSLCEYSYMLRNAGIRGMREAKGKTVQVMNADTIGIDGEDCGLRGSPTRVESIDRQISGRRHGKMVKDAGELAELLREKLQ